ncbi:MAG: hypothetical protein ACI90V_010825 [Bacillariaceae sp.]
MLSIKNKIIIRLKKSAYARLMLNGWRDEIKQHTREALHLSNGGTDSIDEITLDELSATIVNHSLGASSSSVITIKEEFSLKIRQSCGYNDTIEQQKHR